MKKKVTDKFEFLVEAVKNWKQSGAITQSGPNLCKAMVEHIDPRNDQMIIEFGAGDGVMTKYILDKMSPNARLLSFEINESLFQKLDEIDDLRFKAILDSAENLQEHLDAHKFDRVDTIISGIPFVVLPTELTFKILTNAKNVLKPGGLFVQFHYSKLLKDLYQTIFGNYDTKIILMNTPPAFVFTCEKK